MKVAASLSCLAACLFFFAGCSEEKKPSSSSNPLSAPADYLGALDKAQKSAGKTLGGVGLDQAIKTFHTEHGRLPKDLDEMVTKGTIPKVPEPPRGMKYDYDAKTGVIKVVPE